MNKKIYSIVFATLLIATTALSQTGTIKVAKPKPTPKPIPQKEPVQPVQHQKAILINAAGNYALKDINKMGYEAEVLLPLWNNLFFWGIKYSHESEYYNLQPYDTETSTSAFAYSKSISESDYLKMPIGFSTFMVNHNVQISGGRRTGNVCLSWGIAPEYLLKTKNQYGRLNYGDFNKFNLSGFAGIGIPIRQSFAINLNYSRDFFNNLKDNNIYNEIGTVVGKRKTKTNLVSISVSYRIKYGDKNK